MLKYNPKWKTGDNFKSIDEWLDHSIFQMCNDVENMTQIQDVINYIVSNTPSEILTLLKSKDNKNSKYDLIIITTIQKYLSVKGSNRVTAFSRDTLVKILELYKDRKV